MSYPNFSVLTLRPAMLEYRGVTAVKDQILLLLLSVVLPVICHQLSAPVRMILPMHWPVLLAGILYGWRAGAVTGALAPLLSYAVSGFPMPNILPSMTFELMVYGGVAGASRLYLNAFASLASALIAGRIVFVTAVLITGRAAIGNTEYFSAALLPGIIPAVLQMASLPFIAAWLVNRNHRQE